ncbi:unnamed protein product [Cylindrotheca closterium]|uniref:Uncharacterized protein n=1 Tax=Cylindrotheca closterium TaxID=2856 RepID=A0AAD2FTY9_9STRA|nr:unnamed protein product [Cylindrotheca closterium]
MSWFLTTQLLETTLREASKGEDKSNISMDDIQKLADVLQRTEEEMLQPPNAETSELDEGAMSSEVKDTKSEVTVVDEKDESLMAEDQAQNASAGAEIMGSQAEGLVTTKSIESENASNEVSSQEASTSELAVHQQEGAKSGITEPDSPTEATAEESEAELSVESAIDSTTHVQPEIGTAEEKSNAEVVKESIFDGETNKIAVREGDTPRGEEEETDNGSLRPGAARIPDVISTTFGRSLEVVSSAIPPLRDSSIPKTSGWAPSIQAPKKSRDETTGEIESNTVIERSSSTTTAVSLQNSWRVPLEKSGTEDDIDPECAAKAFEDRTFYNVSPKEEQPNRIESTDNKEDGVVHNESVEVKEECISTIGEPSTSKKLIHMASRVTPTPEVSQDALGAKYAEMTLEDKAFEILKDLGMIEIHEFSTEEEQRNDSVVVDSTKSGFEMIEGVCDEEEVMLARNTELPQLKNETLSKRQRFFRPIQRVLDKSKEKFVVKSAATTVTPEDTTLSLSEATTRARRQPKSASEEAILAEKYGQLSIEDRAYAILCDLGMIESN